MTETQLLFSPRLASLQRTLASGNEAALDLFWQEIEAVGIPLIESITTDDSQMLVTFLYRAPLAVRSVEVVCPLAGRGQINEPLTRLLATSLWYKTYRVRPGLRTEYWFSVDGVAHPDRLNARTLNFPPDEDAFHDKTVPRSWFEVPPAEAESWMESRPSFPSGHVERVRLRSLVLGNVLSQSGSFYWKPDSEVEYEWLPRQLVASPRLPLKWYLSAGLLETHSWEGARPNLLLANRHLRDILQAKGYGLHYTEFNGGHDYVWQLSSLAEGLRVLLGTASRKA